MPKKTPTFLWEIALDQVHNIWKGKVNLKDSHLSKNCSHLVPEDKELEIPNELKACRREVLYCFFKDRQMSLKHKNQFHPFHVSFSSNFLTYSEERLPSSITLAINDEQKKFKISDRCRQVSLPQGAYWGNRLTNKEQRIWHTSEVNYSIDRFLVRNIDIREWLLRSSEDKFSDLRKRYLSLSSDKGIDWFSPSVDLMSEQMEAYCSYREAEVLSSQVRTSISFHHGRRQVAQIGLEPPSYNTPPHPFGIRQQDSPQYRLSKGGAKDAKATKDDCRLIYGRDCLEFSFFELFPNSLGWLGVAEIFGGPAEYVKNNRFPRKNLHPSSYYHPVRSKVHQAGKRVYWSGKSNRRIDFNFFTEPFFEVNQNNPKDFFDVGFRCMKKSLEF